MRILMVSMNSIHFRRWTSQLEDSGHEVYWFDALGAEGTVKELSWVSQKTNWRLRIKKGRYILKKIPWLKKINERDINRAFTKYLEEVQPDIVHSFAFQISVIPILNSIKQYPMIKWVVSSWGSDVYNFKQLGISKDQFSESLNYLDYMFTDCLRDARIVEKYGFSGKHLGVFPGNGGIDFTIPMADLKRPHDRKRIFIKAYNNDIGQGDVIIKSILAMPMNLLEDYILVFLGASSMSAAALRANTSGLKIEVYPKNNPIKNSRVLELLSNSYIYIGNSLSDGIPNVLLEAMGNGAFPIQSNPGDVTREIIENEKNGILIENPLDFNEIKRHITKALLDHKMVEECFEYNIEKIRSKCNRRDLKKQIEDAYVQMA